MPVYSSTIYLVADKYSNAALVEGFDSRFSIIWLEDHSPEQFIQSTNHYTHLDFVPLNKHMNPWLKPNSEIRDKAINSKIKSNIPNITKVAVLEILSKEIPDYICAFFFSEWFGTLWSLLFNIKEISLDVCFGPPSHNSYYQFTMETLIKDNIYNAILKNKISTFPLP
jgi:hypothetical protein